MGGFNKFSRGRDDRGPRRNGGDFDGPRKFSSGQGGDRPKQLFQATCTKCGKQCSIPFKPIGNRPVFCRECFKEQNGGGSDFAPKTYGNSDREKRTYAPASGGAPGAGITKAQFDSLYSKVERILSILTANDTVTMPADNDLFDDESEKKTESKPKKLSKKSKGKKK